MTKCTRIDENEWIDHLDTCPFAATRPPDGCEWCVRARRACWVTQGGQAFHVNAECPALHELRTHPVVRTTVLSAKVRYSGCEICVNGVCLACVRGRHDRCNPKAMKLATCSCQAAGHPRR